MGRMPASCAPPRSRSRRSRSRGRATTSTSRDLAIASASHRATDDQIAAVRALLAKAPATEDDLELGPQAGRPAGRIFNNCSGKHAGHARALPRARLGRPRATASRDIPCRRPASPRTPRRPRSIPRSSPPVSTAAASSPSRSRSSAWRMPSPASRALPGAARVVDAMRAHPDLVGGPDGADFQADARRSRLVREGRRRRPALCRRAGRHRHRAQVRGRLLPSPRARRSPPSSGRSASTCPGLADVADREQPRRARRRMRRQQFVTGELFFTNL